MTLVDGRRDVPGVKFRRDEVLLVPAPERSFFLAGGRLRSLRPEEGAGRRQRRSAALGRGRRATALDVFSFVILEDGTYELQVSRRRPERDGVRLEFERIVDGEVVRHMTGHAVRRPSRPHALAAPLRPRLRARGRRSRRPAACGREEARYVTIATGSVTGTYYPVGSLIANLLSRPPGARACDEAGGCGVPNLILVVEASKGSVANVAGDRRRARSRPASPRATSPTAPSPAPACSPASRR